MSFPHFIQKWIVRRYRREDEFGGVEHAVRSGRFGGYFFFSSKAFQRVKQLLGEEEEEEHCVCAAFWEDIKPYRDIHLPSVRVHTSFLSEDHFYDLLHMLARRDELRSLFVMYGDNEPSVHDPLPILASAFQPCQLERLHLKILNHQGDPRAIRQVVKIPTQDIVLELFSSPDPLFLSTLKQGLQDLEQSSHTISIPNVELRVFGGLEGILTQVRATNCINTLRCPSCGTLPDGSFFIRALAKLLEANDDVDRLTCLEFCFRMGIPVSVTATEHFRRALEGNTHLKELSIPHCVDVDFWNRGVLEALRTGNRTVTSLYLPSEMVPAFLRHGPPPGVRYVTTPCTPRVLPRWLHALEYTAVSIWQITFAPKEDDDGNDVPRSQREERDVALIQDYCRRNRAMHRAHQLLSESSSDGMGAVMDAFAEYNRVDWGISAVYLLVRDSLELF